jgi:hypothetical protein
MSTPAGYQLQTRPRWGWVIPGAILFTLGYGLAVAYALEPGNQDEFWLFFPVVGPAARVSVEMAECDNCGFGRIAKRSGFAAVALTFQAPGAAMAIGGIVSPKKRFVRNDLASLTVVPMAVPGGAGMGVTGKF